MKMEVQTMYKKFLKAFLLFVVAVLLLPALAGCNGQTSTIPMSSTKLEGKFIAVNEKEKKLVVIGPQGDLIKTIDTYGNNLELEYKQVGSDGNVFNSTEEVNVLIPSSMILLSPNSENFCYQKFYSRTTNYYYSYIYYMNTTSLQLNEVPLDHNTCVGCVQWISDEVISFVTLDLEEEIKELYTFNTKTKEKKKITTLNPCPTYGYFDDQFVGWCPGTNMFYNFNNGYHGDGTYEVCTVQNDGTVDILSISIDPEVPYRPYWSKDGSTIFFRDYDSNIKSVNVATGEVKGLIPAAVIENIINDKIFYYNGVDRGGYWTADQDGQNQKIVWKVRSAKNDEEKVDLCTGFYGNLALFQEVVETEKNTKIKSCLVDLSTLQSYTINLPRLSSSQLLRIVSPDERYFLYQIEEGEWKTKVYYLFDLRARKIVGVEDFSPSASYKIYRWLK